MARNRFTTLAREAGQKTNAELASELTDLTKLTQRELKDLLPRATDKERLAELMAIVTANTAEARKLTQLKDGIDRLGPVVLKVLRLLA